MGILLIKGVEAMKIVPRFDEAIATLQQ